MGLSKLFRAKFCFEVEKNLYEISKKRVLLCKVFLRSFGERCELGLTFGKNCVIVCLGKG